LLWQSAVCFSREVRATSLEGLCRPRGDRRGRASLIGADSGKICAFELNNSAEEVHEERGGSRGDC
jgi:hypothetical protein